MPKSVQSDPATEALNTGSDNHIVITESEDKRARWYIVHTYSGHEMKVAETLKQRAQTLNLTDKILEILVPTQEKIQIKRGQRKTVREKIFPGYMLVRLILSDESWLAIRTTQGVTGFVGVGNKPTPLPSHEVNSIQKYMTQGAPSYKADFSIDQAVKIVDGPFTDFLGSVNSIDEEKGKVTVLVSIFGRETPVELDFLQVEKV
jgi:transcription termination/antitermination protein NusG